MNCARVPGLSGLAALLLFTLPAAADVKLPNIFGSHMVLQRDQKDPVWGWAEPGEEVTAMIGDQKKTTKAGADGSWKIVLDPLPAGGPHTLTIKGKNSITFDDVLVGEVWICSGQSNMQWDLAAANDSDIETLTAKFPKIRLISVPQVGTQEVQKDFNGKWATCTPETARTFSAVGFLFGRILSQALDIPIGLIDNAWGGSACEAWIRRDILQGDPNYSAMMDRWKDMEAKYQSGSEEDKKKLEGNMRGNARPGNIYNGVLKPTIGYGIRGAIWYQGESNAGRAYQYRDLFPLMIKSWRDEWAQGEFPFYYVQLADYMAETPDPVDSAWAELREAQTMTMSKLPKTGQAVIIDIGEGRDIHPRNKQDVAKRLARWALANDYGIKIPFRSPEFKSCEKQGNKFVLKFDNVPGGLYNFDVDKPRGFAIAGDDKKLCLGRRQDHARHHRSLERQGERASLGPLRLGRQPGLQRLRAGLGPAAHAVPHGRLEGKDGRR
ncbi:MAG: sialate O-acetylesterase [Isosphaeraceae bacterium]